MSRVAFAVDEGERMQKPSGSGFGAGGGSYAELSMLERKENVRGSERGRSGRPSKGGAEGCVFILHPRDIQNVSKALLIQHAFLLVRVCF